MLWPVVCISSKYTCFNVDRPPRRAATRSRCQEQLHWCRQKLTEVEKVTHSVGQAHDTSPGQPVIHSKRVFIQITVRISHFWMIELLLRWSRAWDEQFLKVIGHLFGWKKRLTHTQSLGMHFRYNVHNSGTLWRPIQDSRCSTSGSSKTLMSRCRAMLELSLEGDTSTRQKLDAGANYYKYKLKHNYCTTERDFMNLAERPHGGEDHQHDFETDNIMTTVTDKAYAGQSCKELHDILNGRFRDELKCWGRVVRDNTTHPFLHTNHFTGPDKSQHDNNLTPRRRSCTSWRCVTVTSWLPWHSGSRQGIHSTRELLRRKAADGPSHHWHTLDVGGEHMSLTRILPKCIAEISSTALPLALLHDAGCWSPSCSSRSGSCQERHSCWTWRIRKRWKRTTDSADRVIQNAGCLFFMCGPFWRVQLIETKGNPRQHATQAVLGLFGAGKYSEYTSEHQILWGFSNDVCSGYILWVFWCMACWVTWN